MSVNIYLLQIMSTKIDARRKLLFKLLDGQHMGIWLELGIFVLFFVFALWQMHDVRKAREQTRALRERGKAIQPKVSERPEDGPI